MFLIASRRLTATRSSGSSPFVGCISGLDARLRCRRQASDELNWRRPAFVSQYPHTRRIPRLITNALNPDAVRTWPLVSCP